MTALILVDLQNDFVPGGALQVLEGDKIISIINKISQLKFDIIVATKDWHPQDHGSFAPNHPHTKPGDKIILEDLVQILWPPHCIQETKGSEFVKDLDLTPIQKIFYKGIDKNIDSYSAFFDNAHKRETGLGSYLKSQNIHTVYFAGLATDYCVKYSVLDAIHLGFKAKVIVDACRGVNLKSQDTELALQEMKKAGAEIINSTDIQL